MLGLQRNLHFEVHQVLRLPRNLHFEVRQLVCVPRNLYFEVHLSAAPATKSAHRGCAGHEICISRFTCAAPATKCTSRFTKCCTCHEICTSRFTKCCACHESRFTKRYACHEICTSRFTKCCACHEICTSRFTKRCACHEICTSRFTKCCACHELCTSRFTKCCARHEICKRATCPKVKIHCTCHEIWAPRRSPPCPKCCTCHENCTSKQNSSDPLHLSRKVDFAAPKHEVSLAVTTMCENAHGATTRAQSLEAPTAATQILRACAVEVHMDDVERQECTVNSSALAGHARALQRSKHQLLFSYRKNP